MDEKKSQELDQWFSTYGTITAERILGTYKISLSQLELVKAVKSPTSFYHHLIQVPLKNVLNGIVMQQVHDYHVYAQKLFIDYLLSGETGKTEEEQGGQTRVVLEEERQDLIKLGESFQALQLEHQDLIARSQAFLIKFTKEWKTDFESTQAKLGQLLAANRIKVKKSELRGALNHAFIHCNLSSEEEKGGDEAFIEWCNAVLKLSLSDAVRVQMVSVLAALLQITRSFKEKIMSYTQKTTELAEQLIASRTQFYNAILRITELMSSLSEYRIDPVQDAINREPLYFDKMLGTDKYE